MSKYRYRLKRNARSFPSHAEWAICDESEKERIDKQAPNRFEFEKLVEAEIPPQAVVKPKEKKTEDKK